MKNWITVSKNLMFIAAVLMAGILIPIVFIYGATWVSARILPWLFTATAIAFTVCLIILLPLSFFQRTRRFSAKGFLITSFVFGSTAWAWSLVLTYSLWGGIAVFIGILIAGFGIVPMALLASAFNGLWSAFFQILFLLILTWGIRFFCFWLEERANKIDEEQYIKMVRESPPHIDQVQ